MKSPIAKMLLLSIRELEKELIKAPKKRHKKLLNKKCTLVIRYIEELRKKYLLN